MIQEHIPVPNKMHQEEQQKATALASAAFISSLGDQEALERPLDSVSALQVSARSTLVFLRARSIGEGSQVQHETVGAFDAKPRPREEALRKLEERAGPDARKLFEAFLRKIDKLEVEQS